MVPIARSVHRTVGDSGTAVWLLRNRVRGWNEPARDALRDAQWALDQARTQHPQALVVLVGQSMGGRAALLSAGTEGVLAVCALAPWPEPDDPVTQLAGRRVRVRRGRSRCRTAAPGDPGSAGGTDTGRTAATADLAVDMGTGCPAEEQRWAARGLVDNAARKERRPDTFEKSWKAPSGRAANRAETR